MEDQFNQKNLKLMAEKNATLQKLKSFEAWQKQYLTILHFMVVFHKIRCIKYSGDVIRKEVQRLNYSAMRIQRWIKSCWRKRTINEGEGLIEELKQRYKYVIEATCEECDSR